jgi:SH3 domain-containing YSC84-like protein 1
MKILLATASAVLAVMPAFAQKTAADRLQSATTALNDIMKADDKGIPQDLLDKASCVVVIPNLKKAGFVVGGQYGRGFFTCRRTSGHGWTAPGGVKVEGGKFGFLIGGAETDLIMLVMNENGIHHLLSDKFTLGAEASAAAGPLGRDSSAMTDAAMHAEILTYSRQRGLYGGVSLDGSTMREDDESNRELYGHDLKNSSLLESHEPVPEAARGFVKALNRTSPSK